MTDAQTGAGHTPTLLPCPFCGGQPKVVTCQSGEDCMVAFVQCDECDCYTDAFEDAYAPVGQAIDAWNRRAPVYDHAELLGALKLADAMLSGANMNAKVVEKKVRTAIANAERAEREGK